MDPTEAAPQPGVLPWKDLGLRECLKAEGHGRCWPGLRLVWPPDQLPTVPQTDLIPQMGAPVCRGGAHHPGTTTAPGYHGTPCWADEGRAGDSG